tara:strand:+ start:118 stop:651 length:534 start_codon:yes stop_codon:yes gene_type:complete
MTTKTKTNKALKAEIKGELESQKEIKRLENVKLNSNLREVIIYTKETCPYCIGFIKVLNDEGIKYVNKEIKQEGVREEFNNVTALTGQGVFPTILTNDNYLIPNRDFRGMPQGIQMIKTIAHPSYVNPPNDLKMIEMMKQMNATFQQGIEGIQRSIQPIQNFMTDIQKEIEEEEKNA